MRSFVLILSLGAALLACGTSVTPDAEQSAAVAGAGGASSSASGSGGSTNPCGAAYIDVEGYGPPQHLTSDCNYLGHATPIAFNASQGGFAIMGCAGPESDAESLSVSIPEAAAVGQFKATGIYRDAMKTFWPASAAELTITKLPANDGELVEGSYTMTAAPMSDAGPVKMLGGTLKACKVTIGWGGSSP